MDERRERPTSKPGGWLFALVFLAIAIGLLSLIQTETKFSGFAKAIEKGQIFAKGKLVAQPTFWPLVGLLGMTLFGAAHALREWRARVGGAGAESLVWLRPLEYFIWFMLYVQAVPAIGYLISTILFTCLLALRAGYRRPRTLALAAATGLAIVLIFKTMLSVKIPGGAVYEYLPDAWRTFAIVNF